LSYDYALTDIYTISLHDALPICPSITETDDATLAVHGRTDHRHAEGAGGRGEDGGCLPQVWHLGSDLLQVQGEVRRHGRFRCARSEEHTSELQSRENLVCRLLLE